MEFVIQASSPRGSGEMDPNDWSLDDAIQTAFHLDTEHWFILWHHFSIRLSYKYTFPFFMDEVLIMLRTLADLDEGQMRVGPFASNFRGSWDFIWKSNGEVQITAEWEQLPGDVDEDIRKHPVIHVNKIEFLNEWKKPLENIIRVLQASGYEPKKINKYAELLEVYGLIPGVGRMYR